MIRKLMRILYFSRDYGSYTTTFIRNQVEHFAAEYECLYLCQYCFGEKPGFVKVVPYRSRFFDRLLWKLGIAANFYNKQYSRTITAIVEEFKPDIIHCNFVVEALMLLDNIDYEKYPVIVHFHGYDASQAIRRPAYIRRLKELFVQPNIVSVSCNRFFANRLAGILRIPVFKFNVLRCGIDIGLFRRKALTEPGTEKIFLQISSFSEKKGHAFTVKAFSIFLKNTGRADCKLVFAGDGKLRAHIERYAADLGIYNYVECKGIVSPVEAVDLLQRADVFVHHSVTAANGDMDGLPNSIIEAMAMQLPVLSTYHSGIPELVENKVNGYLVKERDVVDYANKMDKILTMGLLPANRTKVEQCYELHRQNKLLEELYKKYQI